MAYEMIEVRTEGGKVGVVTLNRPKQLNALNNQLMDELGAALKADRAGLGEKLALFKLKLVLDAAEQCVVNDSRSDV